MTPTRYGLETAVFHLVDAVEVVGKPRITADGYLVANARIARTGIQEYYASELGLTDRAADDVIRVYRPEEAVFDKKAMAHLAGVPMTDDHPAETVTADNWNLLSKGHVGDTIARDGEWLVAPLTLRDAGAVKKWQDGKRGLSVGYSCELTFGDGVTPSGEAYDAVQSNIHPNHVALCDTGRAGPLARIGDHPQRRDDVTPPAKDTTMKTLTIDGLPINDVSPGAEAAITLLQGQLADAKGVLTKAQADAAVALAAKDEQIGKLDAELATAKGQILTGDALDKAIIARTQLIADAKRIAPDLKTDGLADADIRKAAVLAKLGDTYAGRDAVFMDHAFELQLALAGDGDGGSSGIDPLRDALKDAKPAPSELKAVADARAAMIADYQKAPATVQ